MLRIFYDAALPDAGGTTIKPSLADVKAGKTGTAADSAKPASDIKPLTTPVVNLEQAIQLQKDRDKTPPPADAPPAKTPEQLAEEERVKAAAGSTTDDPPVDGTEGDVQLTDEQIATRFWETVEQKTGRSVKVEYPTGIDPISPEGVALREEAVRATAEQDFERRIKAANPRGYAYMLHLEQGGTDEEFLGKGVGMSLPERTLLETDIKTQEMILRQDLRAKGVEPDMIDAMVDKSIKDNKLKETSLRAYDGIAKAQRDQLAIIEQREVQGRQRESQLADNFNKSVTKTLSEMRFTVPEADKAGFEQFIMNNVQLGSDGLFIVQAIDPANLKTQLESLFFSYKGGDLTKIIQKQAATVASQRLRTSVDAAKSKVPGSADPDKKPVQKLTLSQVMKLKQD